MADLSTAAPSVPQAQLVDAKGIPTTAWYSFFVTLWQRTGGAVASLSPLLDVLISSPGALVYRGATAWTGLKAGLQYQVLRAGEAFPDWEFLDGKSFGNQPANEFFAAPDGVGGEPAFRVLATGDLNSIAGQIPGTVNNDAATPGNVGEYVFADIEYAARVSLSNSVTHDITSIQLTEGDWDVWGNFVSAPDNTTTTSSIKAWINTQSVTDPQAPNKGAYALLQTAIGATLFQALPLGMMRVTVAKGATQNVYLTAQVAFAVSTLSGYGFIGARRRR
jgi:hypothetical protein